MSVLTRAASQKMAFFIVTALKTSHPTLNKGDEEIFFSDHVVN
jgi:hypothetical protein